MLQDSVIAYKESKLFFAHAPNITVLQKGGRIPLIKGDACFAATTIQWRLFAALLEQAACKCLMEANDRLPKATVSFH